MNIKSYGIKNKVTVSSELEKHLENLEINGYSISERSIDIATCNLYSQLLEEIYTKQECEIGSDNLVSMNEQDIVRMPLLYESSFFDIIKNSYVLEMVERVLEGSFYLHVQNGIINRPQKVHHQTAWHRDLPYQDWVNSKPLAINAFMCLSDFTTENGATFVLPFSHRLDFFPSENFISRNEVQLVAPQGSIIYFDSMLYHRAGINTSQTVRYGLNNMYVAPFIKQQIDLASIVSGLTEDNEIRKLLGYEFRLENSVKDYRERKLEKMRHKNIPTE